MKSSKINNDGLSLIELLITVAIMGTVISLISVIMVTGTNFFRRQSANAVLQSDSHMITTNITKAILEGSDFDMADVNLDGINCRVLETGEKSFVWVMDTSAANNRYFYVYDSTEDIDSFDLGHCLSKSVDTFDITVYVVSSGTDAFGNTVPLCIAVDDSDVATINSFMIDYYMSNDFASLQQNFEVKPRNSDVKFLRH